jgi:hypothetical protein
MYVESAPGEKSLLFIGDAVYVNAQKETAAQT